TFLPGLLWGWLYQRHGTLVLSPPPAQRLGGGGGGGGGSCGVCGCPFSRSIGWSTISASGVSTFSLGRRGSAGGAPAASGPGPDRGWGASSSSGRRPPARISVASTSAWSCRCSSGAGLVGSLPRATRG